jgi:murein L,D-transpeptidase YafK
MTDEQIGEIYALAREAFLGGQRDFEVHAFPFRMTAQNLAKHHNDPNLPFWQMLKVGYDHFEVTHRVPDVKVCDHTYVFDAVSDGGAFDPDAACPPYHVASAIQAAVDARERADDLAYQSAVAAMGAAAGQSVAASSVRPLSSYVWTVAYATPAPAPAPLPNPRGAEFAAMFGN